MIHIRTFTIKNRIVKYIFLIYLIGKIYYSNIKFKQKSSKLLLLKSYSIEVPSRGRLCFTGQICDNFVKSVTCLCFLITNIKYDFFNSFTLVIPPATWVSSLS